MKFITFAILLLSATLAGHAAPQESAPTPPTKPSVKQTPPAVPISSPAVPQPLRYILLETTCAIPEPTRNVWRVEIEPGQTGAVPPASDLNFDTLASPQLRQWVSGLPKGSTILLIVRGLRNRVSDTPNPAVTARLAELADFNHFCQSKRVLFTNSITGSPYQAPSYLPL